MGLQIIRLLLFQRIVIVILGLLRRERLVGIRVIWMLWLLLLLGIGRLGLWSTTHSVLRKSAGMMILGRALIIMRIMVIEL